MKESPGDGLATINRAFASEWYLCLAWTWRVSSEWPAFCFVLIILVLTVFHALN